MIMRTEATLLINGVPIGKVPDVTMSIVNGGSFGAWAYASEPDLPKLTLADAVRIQSVRWHSFVIWYATGEVTGRMYPPEYEYVGPEWLEFPKALP